MARFDEDLVFEEARDRAHGLGDDRCKFYIPCPFCDNEAANITYEEARLYQLSCRRCGNKVLHIDSSWLNAQHFFEKIKFGGNHGTDEK